MAAVGAGTQCSVIGAGGGVDGFHPTARLIMAGGLPMVARIMPTVGQAATVPRMTGARFGIPTEAGEAPRVAGVIHSQSQTGLTPSDLLRVRLRILAISFARVALPS